MNPLSSYFRFPFLRVPASYRFFSFQAVSLVKTHVEPNSRSLMEVCTFIIHCIWKVEGGGSGALLLKCNCFFTFLPCSPSRMSTLQKVMEETSVEDKVLLHDLTTCVEHHSAIPYKSFFSLPFLYNILQVPQQ